MDKNRWFTVATEGQTTDGRNILRTWLEQIAETYNRETYGARIWMEHIRGLVPESPFKAYGDVLAVRTQENSAGKLELQAQLDPTPELVAMTKGRQKIYTSIELQEDFAGTGKCGLIGLGVTDSPASLGTSILEFAAKNPAANPLAARKQSPNNLFSSALETALNFDADPKASDEAASAFQAIGAFFRTLLPSQPQPAQQPAPQQPAPAAFSATDVDSAVRAFAALEKAFKQTTDSLAQSVAQLTEEVQEFKKSAASAKDLAELRADLDKTPGNFTQRPQASGGAGRVQTDC